MSEPVIHLEGLDVRVGRRSTLSVGMLRVGRGELVGVLGPNGAGKSTLLRCLLGMQDGVAGRVEVLGVPVNGRRAGPMAA